MMKKLILSAIPLSLSLLLSSPQDSEQNQQQPTKVKLEYGPETTVISEPRREDGTIDYVAALNERFSEGVTKDNNAAIAILLTMPQTQWDEWQHRWHDEAIRRLGIDEPGNMAQFVPIDRMPVPEDVTEVEVLDQHIAAGRRPWTSLEFPLVAAWLVANHDVLQRIEDASHKTRFFVPRIPAESEPRMIGEPLLHLGHVREVAEAFVIRANRAVAAGHIQSALEDIFTMKRLSRLVGQVPSLTGVRVAYAIAWQASRTTVILAGCPKFREEDAIEVIARLDDVEALPTMKLPFDTTARFLSLEVAQYFGGLFEAERGMPPKGGLTIEQRDRFLNTYDPNQAMRTFNSLFDQMVEIAIATSFNEVQQKSMAFEVTVEQLLKHPSPANVEAFLKMPQEEAQEQHTKVLVNLLLPDTGVEREWKTRAMEDLELIAIALGGYHAEHGRFPAELSDLSPAFLDQIPVDRFNNQPLNYRIEDDGSTAVIWSVGPDLENDGGEDENREDVVIRVTRGA